MKYTLAFLAADNYANKGFLSLGASLARGWGIFLFFFDLPVDISLPCPSSQELLWFCTPSCLLEVVRLRDFHPLLPRQDLVELVLKALSGHPRFLISHSAILCPYRY